LIEVLRRGAIVALPPSLGSRWEEKGEKREKEGKRFERRVRLDSVDKLVVVQRFRKASLISRRAEEKPRVARTSCRGKLNKHNRQGNTTSINDKGKAIVTSFATIILSLHPTQDNMNSFIESDTLSEVATESQLSSSTISDTRKHNSPRIRHKRLSLPLLQLQHLQSHLLSSSLVLLSQGSN